MKRKAYPDEFRDQALSKAQARGGRTLAEIANELNLSLGTLKGWIKQQNKAQVLTGHPVALPTHTAASTWSAGERLSALLASHGYKDQALHAWCRENGVFEHQLRQWHHEFCQLGKVTVPTASALREVKQKNDQLERELRRKDKALAEAAALLILQKKFQALWEGEEK
jgi:transposase-like protein